MWYKEDEIEHFIFLDPKGINNFNVDAVWEKISFSFEIKSIQQQLNEQHPNLRLHSFILPTKTLDDLATRAEIKNTLNVHIAKAIHGELVELSEEQIKNALSRLNVICVQDETLISKIIEKLCDENTFNSESFLKEL